MSNTTSAPAPKSAPKPKPVEDQDDTPGGTETQTEIDIAKFARRVDRMKHIDAKVAMMDYTFPLLRRLAKENGDLAEAVEDLRDAYAANTVSFETEVKEMLEDARNALAKLASAFDDAMVHAGFCVVSKVKTEAGEAVVMKVTEKMPKTLLAAYEEATNEVRDVVGDIQDMLEDIETRLADSVDPEDDQGDDSDEPNVEPSAPVIEAPIIEVSDVAKLPENPVVDVIDATTVETIDTTVETAAKQGGTDAP